MAADFSTECIHVLDQLRMSRNVLISGPPGTGKSRLLGEIAQAFEIGAPKSGKAPFPIHNTKGAVPIPPPPVELPGAFLKAMPCPAKTSRKVFRTVFHQNSKHRDFATGLIPNVARKTGEPEFTIIQGTLYLASEHAKRNDGAALITIDEINRGPAVQVFGGSIVAIEADKRLSSDGSPNTQTQFFDVLDPATGRIISYALPEDLYIVAAMNQADASVEPLDVAFLRRWESFVLEPSETVLRKWFGLGAADNAALPDVPTGVEHVFEASVRAWRKINRRISLGRGSEFQIGHGVLMYPFGPKPGLDEVLHLTATTWAKVRAHVQEVFFGDIRGIAAALNAAEGPAFHPLRLAEATFGDDIRFELQGPSRIHSDRIYDALRAISAGE